MNLDGRVAIVTGGSRGVGRGIGCELAHLGARVFITGRSMPDRERRDDRITGIACDRTEKVMEAAKWLDMTNSESPEFIGRAVAALATDPDVLRFTGKVQVAARLAEECGFTDTDGKAPRPLGLADV